jgi:formiminotetrahydrofolate cyclodeaminase
MAGGFGDQRLAEFTDQVAARGSAPGGGSVTAISASLAAGLVAMAARFSAYPGVEQLVDDADRLRLRAAVLADADADAYGAVLAERASGGGHPGSEQRMQVLLRRASEVPLEVSDVGVETAQLAASVLREGNPHLRGDAAAGLLLAEAAVRAAAVLVRLNVGSDPGEADLIRRAAGNVAAAQAARREVESVLPRLLG